MSKKLFTGLLPLLAFAAFAVPAQAAANLHWYSGGSSKPIKEGVTTKIITWGEKKELSQVSGIGKIECASVGSGTIENPAAGGAGKGVGRESTFYECKAEGCEAFIAKEFPTTPKSVSYAYIVASVATSGKTEPTPNGEEEWRNQLYEGEALSAPLTPGNAAGPVRIREAIGKEDHVVTGGTESAEEIKAEVDCDIAKQTGVPAPVPVITAKFSGELDPETGNEEPFGGANLNGISGCNKPTHAQFTGPSSGNLASGLAGEGSNSGLIKYCGSNEQELITVGEA